MKFLMYRVKPLAFCFIYSLMVVSCNPSGTLTNSYNIPYKEIGHLAFVNPENKVVTLTIDDSDVLKHYLNIGKQEQAYIKDSVNFSKESIALILYPETDIDTKIYIDMLVHKADTLKVYYSVISNNEKLNQAVVPYKALVVKKKYKILQLIEND